jgi:hypothetical protein
MVWKMIQDVPDRVVISLDVIRDVNRGTHSLGEYR